MKIKGVIFDLDGTLLDSMWVWDKVDEDFLGARGFDVPEDYQQTIAAMGFRETAIYTIQRFGLKEEPDAIIQEWNDMAERTYHNEVRIKSYAKELLECLKGKGIKLGVATAAYRSLFEPCLIKNDVYHYFDAITETKEVPRGKGFPDVYIRAAAKMGCQPEECVVLEDIHAGIVAAKTGGFFTVGVYDEKSSHGWQEIQKDADCVIQGFEELLKGELYQRLFCEDEP